MNENYLAVYALADILQTSLGPNARNKLVVNADQRYHICGDIIL